MDYLEKLEVGTADIRRVLEQKLAAGYTASDIGGAARDVSALWESTLVLSGHSWTSNYLNNQTQDLTALGWLGGSDLDLLRRTNNQAKHGTPVTATGDDILSAIIRLEGHISALPPLVPELRNTVHEPRLRRLICAIYDHFAQGETEFAFIEATPTDTWMTVRTVDEFQIDACHDEHVRGGLEMLPGWEYDPPAFAGLSASLRQSDNELWRIATFTAEYHVAHKIVSAYQHDMPLLRGLHRDDSAENALSSLSLIQAREFTSNGSVLTSADLLASALSEGLVDRRGDLSALADATTVLIKKALPRLRTLTVDRANQRTFESELKRAPLAVNEEHALLISPEGILFVRNSH